MSKLKIRKQRARFLTECVAEGDDGHARPIFVECHPEKLEIWLKQSLTHFSMRWDELFHLMRNTTLAAEAAKKAAWIATATTPHVPPVPMPRPKPPKPSPRTYMNQAARLDIDWKKWPSLLLTPAQLRDMLHLPNTNTVSRLWHSGDLPAPVTTGRNCTRWICDDVKAALLSRRMKLKTEAGALPAGTETANQEKGIEHGSDEPKRIPGA